MGGRPPCETGLDAEAAFVRDSIVEGLGVEQMRQQRRLAPKERVSHAFPGVAAVEPPLPEVAGERTFQDDPSHHAAE